MCEDVADAHACVDDGGYAGADREHVKCRSGHLEYANKPELWREALENYIGFSLIASDNIPLRLQ